MNLTLHPWRWLWDHGEPKALRIARPWETWRAFVQVGPFFLCLWLPWERNANIGVEVSRPFGYAILSFLTGHVGLMSSWSRWLHGFIDNPLFCFGKPSWDPIFEWHRGRMGFGPYVVLNRSGLRWGSSDIPTHTLHFKVDIVLLFAAWTILFLVLGWL